MSSRLPFTRPPRSRVLTFTLLTFALLTPPSARSNDAEAARFAVAHDVPVKLLVDDNDVTITGHPSDFFKGYSVAKTLEGHGLGVQVVDPENMVELYGALRTAVTTDGPFAVVCQRKMCPGIPDVEGTSHGHDAVAVNKAVPYLESRGHTAAAAYLKTITKSVDGYEYEGGGAIGSLRGTVGVTLVEILGRMTPEERFRTVKVIDSDLGGSTAMTKVRCCLEVGRGERAERESGAKAERRWSRKLLIEHLR